VTDSPRTANNSGNETLAWSQVPTETPDNTHPVTPRCGTRNGTHREIVLDHPAYLDLLLTDISAFTDADGHLLLVAPGIVDRYEMADRAYMITAPRLGADELHRRLCLDTTTGNPMLAFAARVEWRGVIVQDDTLRLVPTTYGTPVTVLACINLVTPGEVCDDGTGPTR
jgi:hypothetical protein